MGSTVPQPSPCAGFAPVPARKRHLELTTKGLTHSLKLRTNVRLSTRARLELGADLEFDAAAAPATLGGSTHLLIGGGSLEAASLSPWASLCFQLDEHDRGHGCLRVDTHKACLSQRVLLGPKGSWWAVPLDLCVGVRYHEGAVLWGATPAKWQHNLALGAALLAAGKPVHFHRTELGNWGLQLPIHVTGSPKQSHTLQERVEVDACLRRRGWQGLSLELRQLNAVLRLREV